MPDWPFSSYGVLLGYKQIYQEKGCHKSIIYNTYAIVVVCPLLYLHLPKGEKRLILQLCFSFLIHSLLSPIERGFPMKTIFKKVIVLLLAGSMAVMSVGCFGSFELTKKVYKWNDSMSGKWVKELVFLVLNIVPVYDVAATIDVVILNTIEFWSGENPMMSSITTDDGTTVAFNKEKKETTITYGEKTFVVSYENGKATVKDGEGNVLAYAVSEENGTMNLIAPDGKVIKTYSQDEVATTLAAK